MGRHIASLTLYSSGRAESAQGHQVLLAAPRAGAALAFAGRYRCRWSPSRHFHITKHFFSIEALFRLYYYFMMACCAIFSQHDIYFYRPLSGRHAEDGLPTCFYCKAAWVAPEGTWAQPAYLSIDDYRRHFTPHGACAKMLSRVACFLDADERGHHSYDSPRPL